MHLHDTSFLAVFTDNHDNARFLSDEVTGSIDWDSRVILYKAYTALMLTCSGIPIFYYGSE